MERWWNQTPIKIPIESREIREKREEEKNLQVLCDYEGDDRTLERFNLKVALDF